MWPSVSELQQQLASGQVTASALVRKSLDAIDRHNERLNAFVHVDHEGSLRKAEEVDRRRQSGEPLGCLAGIPIAVKDLICTADLPTTCCSRMLADFRPPYDATVVAKLRQSDAIIVGKTNMDEFAMGASNETSFQGLARNPWDERRTPGGSSGGAAACVAADMVPISLGSDTGGSIRQPAAFCGVTGVKPTYGRVSRYGLVAFASSLDQIGPIAASAEDCAAVLAAISGFDPKDSTSLEADVPRWTGAMQTDDLRGIKVGMLREEASHERLDPEVRRAVESTADRLKDLGAEIIDIRLPHDEYWVPTYYVIAPSEASSNLSRYDGMHYGHRADRVDGEGLTEAYERNRGEGFGSEVKRRIMIGTYALSEGYADQYYNQALKVRRFIRQDYDAAFAQVDVLLGPVTPSPAFALGDKIDDPIEMYLCDLFTVGANLAGVPAISIPAGHDENGLPIGVQLQAPVLEESRLFMMAAALQRATDFHRQRPAAMV